MINNIKNRLIFCYKPVFMLFTIVSIILLIQKSAYFFAIALNLSIFALTLLSTVFIVL